MIPQQVEIVKYILLVLLYSLYLISFPLNVFIIVLNDSWWVPRKVQKYKLNNMYL